MSRTILLADDSSTIQRIVELAFADDPELRVVAASSGQQTLELLESLQPDLLLADVVMPAPAGYELCRKVKQSDRPIPVALLAGTFEPFDRQRAADCGADDFLVKPFETERLKELCERLLRGERAVRPAPVPFHPAAPAADSPADQAMGKVSAAPDAEPTRAVREETNAPHSIEIQSVGDDLSASRGLTVTSIQSASPKGEAAVLSGAQIDLIVERVLERLTRAAVGDWVREGLPAIAREVVAERIRELERLDTTDP